jgi:uroporphyrinogen III methyltransferase/synthase
VAAGIKSPAITVVGQVVKLREILNWFENRPLFGKRILVTRAREQASELAQQLRRQGAQPVEYPVIRIEPLPAADRLFEKLASADWIVFTSANGLPNLLGQLQQAGKDIRALGTAKIAAIGSATAESLRAHGLRWISPPAVSWRKRWPPNSPILPAGASSSRGRKRRGTCCRRH